MGRVTTTKSFCAKQSPCSLAKYNKTSVPTTTTDLVRIPCTGGIRQEGGRLNLFLEKKNQIKKYQRKSNNISFQEPGVIQIQSNNSALLGKIGLSPWILQGLSKMTEKAQKLQQHLLHKRCILYSPYRRKTMGKKQVDCIQFCIYLTVTVLRWEEEMIITRAREHLPTANWIFSIRYFPADYISKIPTSSKIIRMALTVPRLRIQSRQRSAAPQTHCCPYPHKGERKRANKYGESGKSGVCHFSCTRTHCRAGCRT